MRCRSRSSFSSRWCATNSATSASTACCNNSRAPLRNISVSASATGSATPGFRYSTKLSSFTAYSSLSNKVDGSRKLIKNTPPLSFAHTQLSSLTRPDLTVRVALITTCRKDHFIDLSVDVVRECVGLTGWKHDLVQHHGIEDVTPVTDVGVRLSR